MDGLQRESFLPFIHQIQAEFEILHLDNHYDYRLESFIANNHTRLFYPLNKQNNDIMKRIILKKTHNQNLEQTNIEIFGRTLSFLRTYKQTLVSNFHELFVRELSYIDYVNICQKFTTIIVENISIIESNETDIAIRFINFIDNAYFYKVLLFTSLETSPDKLYPNGKRLEEFQRTISRLHEMNNESYMSGKNEF
jgi:cell division protein ZapE